MRMLLTWKEMGRMCGVCVWLGLLGTVWIALQCDGGALLRMGSIDWQGIPGEVAIGCLYVAIHCVVLLFHIRETRGKLN